MKKNRITLLSITLLNIDLGDQWAFWVAFVVVKDDVLRILGIF